MSWAAPLLMSTTSDSLASFMQRLRTPPSLWLSPSTPVASVPASRWALNYTGASATRQEKGDALVNAIFDARIAMEEKDVPTDNLYAVFGPDDYYAITMSSRAINTDFNGGNGSNGTIADGKTLRVAEVPIYSSNNVTQPAYTLVAGDCNAEYAQDLSKCKGLVFHKDVAGVLTLLSPGLQVTSGDWNVSHQSTLLVARQNLGMGVLRSECAVDISIA